MDATVSPKPEQLRVLSISERVGGSLSLACSFLLFILFLKLNRIRTIPNALLILSCFATIAGSVGHLIADSGRTYGPRSVLCLARSVLLEL